MTLDVVTRHYRTDRRAFSLLRQIASLTQLTSRDWTQTILVDPHGRGINATHERMRTYEPCADHVWILDDDDVCAEPGLIDLIDPACELQIFKVLHTRSGTLPHPPYWGVDVVVGQITSCSAIIRKDLWMRARDAWGSRYEGDFDFLRRCYELSTNTLWTDKVIATILDVNRGAA